MSDRENWRHIANNVYIVRTQAGFNQAIRHFTRDYAPDYKQDVFGYPQRYPSLVALSIYYHGSDDVRAQCIPVNDVLEAIAASDSSGTKPDSADG